MRKTAEPGGPVRSCIGCRERRSQSELVRITRSDDGIEVDGPSRGRGAWLCRSLDGSVRAGAGVEPTCFDRAVASRAFVRAWRSDVEASDIANIRSLIGHT